jgi:phosphopantetheinyl transferase (holo-ACP synthase)
LISIGNDIVALSGINRERTNDIRFHSKFITPAELALYQSSALVPIPFESFVWLLWSVKESAYKYQKRLLPQLIFAPTKIVVKNINIPDSYLDKKITNNLEINASAGDLIHGEVYIGVNKLYFKSIINDDLIATVVNNDSSFLDIVWGIQKIERSDNESQSLLARSCLLNKLQTMLPQSNLTLQNSPVGYPVLLNNGSDMGVLISLAHHGCFTSYCFKTDHHILFL